MLFLISRFAQQCLASFPLRREFRCGVLKAFGSPVKALGDDAFLVGFCAEFYFAEQAVDKNGGPQAAVLNFHIFYVDCLKHRASLSTSIVSTCPALTLPSRIALDSGFSISA